MSADVGKQLARAWARALDEHREDVKKVAEILKPYSKRESGGS